MSRIAAQAWVEAGHTNISNLDGGFEAWMAAGYPLLQLGRQ
jgi:rhodanese-related sulfurtransferase